MVVVEDVVMVVEIVIVAAVMVMVMVVPTEMSLLWHEWSH